MTEEQRALASSNLKSSVSLSRFEAVSTENYRKELAESLKGVVKACQVPTWSSGPSITRYNATVLEQCLIAVNWRELCHHYDQRQIKHSNSSDPAVSLTPLEEVIVCLEDPSCWPLACSHVIVKTLLDALTFQKPGVRTIKHRLQWSPSQKLLLEAMTRIISRIPALQSQLGILLSERLSQMHGLAGLHVTPSLIKHWMKTFAKCKLLLVPCILQILAALDEMQNRTTKRPNNKRQRTDSVEESTPSRRIRRAPCSYLDSLHGELSDQEEAKLISTLNRQQRFPRSAASKPTIKEILATEVNETMEFCTEKTREIDRLRSKCLKVFLGTAGQNSPQDCHVATLAILHSVLDTSYRYPKSPLIRLCSILLVNQSETTLDIMQLSNLLWSRAVNKPFFLRFYSEVLVECSYFDNHVRLWDAVLPLRNHLQEFYKQKDNGVDVVSLRPYLRCFAYLLSKRGKILEQQPSFCYLTAQLSVVFDRPMHWIDPNASLQERIQTVQTLQLAGILGVCDDGKMDFRNKESVDRTTTAQPWPFATDRGVRAAARTSGRDHLPRDLLSAYSPNNEIPPIERLFAIAGKSSTGGPIMEYLNEDIFRTIFSFLGYKRLVRMRNVCTEWKQVADSSRLWRSMYESRYGFLADDKLAHDKAAPWKKLFQENWIAEREIRGRPHGKGDWKVKICGYVGCHDVMTSKSRQRKHYAKHRRENDPAKTRLKGRNPKQRKKATKRIENKT